ncbi:MAG: EAL domain-containing protein, partial [Burkholderiales bacterium]
MSQTVLPPPLISSALLSAETAVDLLNKTEQGIFVIQDDVYRYANPAMARMMRTSVDRVVGQPWDIFLPPQSLQHAKKTIERRTAGKEGTWGEMKCKRADGTLIDVRVYGRGIRFNDRFALLATLIDVSELREAVRRAQWNGQMLARTEALARTGSMEVECTGGDVYLSSGLLTLLGLDEAAQVGQLDALAWVPAEERAYVAGIWRAAVLGEPFEFQHRVDCADGQRLTVLHRGVLQAKGERGEVGVALLQDITAQRDAEQRIQELANQDEVTGLPNRAALLDHAEAAILAARWDDRAVVLLVIEVPQLRAIRTSMGFGAGDALAMTLAARLRETCASHEMLGQTGDAEFAVVIEVEGEYDQAALSQRATALLAILSAPVMLGSASVVTQCRVGAAVFPRDADTPTVLLESAQAALFDTGGESGIVFFSRDIADRAQRATRIEGGLRQAIAADELTLHFQPQVDLVSGTIRGAEALLRWHSADLGSVSPGEFIPVAERSGLSGAIGEWVLNAACRTLADWQRRGLPPVRVSINLSSAELQQPDLAAHVQRTLLAHGVAPERLGIELTESMLMADVNLAAQVLRDLKLLGVEIALDDFGTGFSSLSYLCRLPIDVVKVDRSFVHDVTAPVEEVSVTRAIINLAHDLKMQVLAEGVETEGQLSLLASSGCDHIQGFWFSRPVPAAEFEAMLSAGKELPEQ